MKATILTTTLFFTLALSAQRKVDIADYIQKYNLVAIDEMVRAKIPASITLAQGILESSCGKSSLSTNSNNHFGIKCKEDWQGKRYYHDDDAPQECFRVYEHAEASYADHSDFLLTRPRYAPLFQLPIADYKSWAYGLKSAGYATNPQYAAMLIQYIEDNKLYEYDQLALTKMNEKERLLNKPQREEPMASVASSKVVITDVKHTEKHRQIVTEPKNADTGRKEFVVNGVRAIKAIGNEDPFKVAFEYNIDYSYIMLFNDMNTGDRFKEGQNIFLQGKRARGEERNYTVAAGESMHEIAQKTGVKLRELYSKNNMNLNEQVHAGETINLQERRTESPRAMSYAEYLKAQNRTTIHAPAKPTEKVTALVNKELTTPIPNNIVIDVSEYQVQQSDTLYSIARKFNTTVDELKTINNLKSTDLRTGQTLVVSN